MSDRRQFLKTALLGVALVPLLPLTSLVQEQPPKLWGDGFHDDTYALQWRINRGPLIFPKGTYLVSQTLV